ncbi:kinase-like protein [Morchella conica CCBAS932]|uniref:mitogen-activated protein kinase kinase n=1 Tax=Morchella conica CCBAS932 TaxID=1392247 RepID=A0A3N4K8R1_9PEZI|nr:kinase-like protein [Morchella conica CCBAS932]
MMASSTPFSEAERYKFNTIFSNNGSTFQHNIPANPLMATGRCETWKRVKLLARGAFGTVWLETEEKGQQLRAVKRIAKTTNALHLRELLTLTKLTYPKHFVQFFGWFESEEDMYFAMEYVKHGDLSRLINKSSAPIAESDVKSISRQILDGLKVMHDNNFCHRDLKPENILVVSPSPIIVKICDFGVSKRLQEGTNFRTTVGTLGYVAPEVSDLFDNDSSVYTCAVDIWSLGCLIFALLTKETPFPATRKLISYVEGLIPFPESKLVERKASQDTIAFIINLMMPEPEARLTAHSALREPWLREELETTGKKGRTSG